MAYCTFCNTKINENDQVYPYVHYDKYYACYDCLRGFVIENLKSRKVTVKMLVQTESAHHDDGYHSGKECQYSKDTEEIEIEIPLNEVEDYNVDKLDPPFTVDWRECVCCSISDECIDHGLGHHQFCRKIIAIEIIE